MSSKVLITDKAREMLEAEMARRINENWKRGYSLEQIATEAVFFYFQYGGYLNVMRDDNTILGDA